MDRLSQYSCAYQIFSRNTPVFEVIIWTIVVSGIKKPSIFLTVWIGSLIGRIKLIFEQANWWKCLLDWPMSALPKTYVMFHFERHTCTSWTSEWKPVTYSNYFLIWSPLSNIAYFYHLLITCHNEDKQWPTKSFISYQAVWGSGPAFPYRFSHSSN